MAKLTLNNITSGYASTAALNANNAAIEAALENTLSRDGTTPNSMSADLDMNGNDILNIGDALIGGVGLAASVASAATSAASASVDAATATAAASTASLAAVDADSSAAIIADWSYQGAWVTSTAYLVNNIIYESTNGSSYICLVDHTSGTFSTDLGAGKWGLLATQGAAGAGTGDMLKSENLSGLANYTTARFNMGLSIGTDIQAQDALLQSLAGQTTANLNVQGYSGVDTATLYTLDATTTLGTSDTAIPTQNAVKTYVDTATASSGNLLAVTRYVSGTSHTFDVSTTKYLFELVGAGGSGAFTAACGGGGAGAITRSGLLAVPGATLDFTLGVGGAAKTVAGNGNDGTASTALSGTYTAPGGKGGRYGGSSGYGAAGGLGGVVGTSPTGFSNKGDGGAAGMYYGSIFATGKGGGPVGGRGNTNSYTDSNVGDPGGYGSGGGAGLTTSSGAGGNGYIIIWEYA